MTGEPLDRHDESAIGHLLNLYHAAVNYREWALLPEIFAGHAVWSAAAPLNLRFEGIAAITAGMSASVARQAFLAQCSSAILIRPIGQGKATVRSTLIEFGKDLQGVNWKAFLEVRDEVCRTEDGWRIVNREVILKNAF